MIIPSPDGLALRQYQQDGALHLMQNQWALLADEPGVGKTAQVIAAINCAYPGVKVFIGCPETLMLNWLRELRTWLVTDRSIGLASSRKVPNTDIVIANYDIFAKIQSALSGRRWNIAVLDEAHKIKSAEAKCTQAAWTINAYHRWALTGTPILNKPVEAWAVLAWMMRDRVMPYDQYTTTFCNAHLREQWSKKFNQKTKKMEAYKKKVWDVSGATNLDQLHKYLLAEGHMLRRRKADVLSELPDKIHQVIELSSTKVHSLLAQEHMGAQALGGYEAAISKLKDGDPVGLEEFTKVRHELALAKVKPAVEFIRNALEEEPKVFVVCHHRDVLMALAAGLPFDSAIIMGGMTAGEKDASVQRFQNDPSCRVFLGNDAACEGITLTAASRCIFVELDPVPGRMTQFEDRLHRMGQKSTVLVQALVFEGSLDVRLLRILWSKEKIINHAVDGRR